MSDSQTLKEIYLCYATSLNMKLLPEAIEHGVGKSPVLLGDKDIDFLEQFPRKYWSQAMKKRYDLFFNYLLNLQKLRDAVYKKNYDDFEMTCILSENVLKKMKLLAESHQAKLLVYILGDLNNTINKMDAIVAACKLNNIAIITGAEELTLIHEKKGETIHSFDNYHFNNNGQKILGQVLIDYFRKNELADKP